MDLFSDTASAKALDVFEVSLIGRASRNWEDLFTGFETFRGITYSSSLSALVQLADRFTDMEITFGSERILSREHAALESVGAAAEGYRFADAVADQKAFTEALARHFSGPARALLPRIVDGTLRFRVLRKAPSHEKLYLLAGRNGLRVITGSANLSLRALEGRQQEMFFCFDGPEAHDAFAAYYARDAEEAAPIDADLIAPCDDRPPEALGPQGLSIEKVPCVRLLQAGAAIIDERRAVPTPPITGEALREAARTGATMRALALEQNRAGKTVVTARSFVRAWRAHAARPIEARDADEVPRAEVDIETGAAIFDGRPFNSHEDTPDAGEASTDAHLIIDYMRGFESFYGDGIGAARQYWALLAWLYASPFVPAMRRVAVLHDASPLAYPLYAVTYGRSDGGKTMFSRVAARSMFGVDKLIRGQHMTANVALGLREKLGAIPLICDDVNRDRFTRQVPDLVKFDQDVAEHVAPVLISTNRDVNVIPPELRKRMVVCHIDAARPKAISDASARKALAQVGTALFRRFLTRFAPEAARLREALAADPLSPPDLILAASSTLAEELAESVDDLPAFTRPIGIGDLDAMKDRPLLEMLGELIEQNPDRVTITPTEITVSFAGDHHGASRFEKLAPAQALKKRFADTVTLDRLALEAEYGFTVPHRGWLARLVGR